jgi:hypothetical protein
MDDQHPITLRDLYPHFTAEQLEEAEANLEEYLTVMLRVAERRRSDGFDLPASDLTVSRTEASIPAAKVEVPTDI